MYLKKRMLKTKIKCPCCDGNRKINGLFPRYSNHNVIKKNVVELKCYLCNGSGKVESFDPEWINQGKILKKRRIQSRITLRNASKILNIDPIELSNMEKGFIEPNMNISYK